MGKDDKREKLSLYVVETAANILGRHGKSDKEIKEFLEYHFPIRSAIIQQIPETRE